VANAPRLARDTAAIADNDPQAKEKVVKRCAAVAEL